MPKQGPFIIKMIPVLKKNKNQTKILKKNKKESTKTIGAGHDGSRPKSRNSRPSRHVISTEFRGLCIQPVPHPQGRVRLNQNRPRGEPKENRAEPSRTAQKNGGQRSRSEPNLKMRHLKVPHLQVPHLFFALSILKTVSW